MELANHLRDAADRLEEQEKEIIRLQDGLKRESRLAETLHDEVRVLNDELEERPHLTRETVESMEIDLGSIFEEIINIEGYPRFRQILQDSLNNIERYYA